MFTQPHPILELKSDYGLTSLEIAQSLGVTNARILNKIKGYAVQQKFIDDPNFQTIKTYQKVEGCKKSMHLVHLNVFAAKIILLSFRSHKAQDYLVYIFHWELFHMSAVKSVPIQKRKNLCDYPDWKDEFVH